MASAHDQNVVPDDNLNEPKDLLSVNEIINDRFVVEEKIGQGSFGQIYRGKDKRQKRCIAIKVEPEQRGELNNSPNDPRRLVIEQQVLIALRKKANLSFILPNIPMIYASGKTERNYPFIVMQMLGKNLTILRKERTEPKFTLSTAFRTGVQVIYHCITFVEFSSLLK
ncbi:unnamed protein product [Acanthocheilonema viteae]|uniref:Protein kinase domain-containing protein n=1 Tax=Acanthocheilonema viteae TaxID=6277 RepID=A0A498SWY0_ACAVI|nr:unnamed protein product [Acanthocheilonema viteae]